MRIAGDAAAMAAAAIMLTLSAVLPGRAPFAGGGFAGSVSLDQRAVQVAARQCSDDPTCVVSVCKRIVHACVHRPTDPVLS